MSNGEYIANTSFRGVRLGMTVDDLVSAFGKPDRIESLNPADAKNSSFQMN